MAKAKVKPVFVALSNEGFVGIGATADLAALDLKDNTSEVATAVIEIDPNVFNKNPSVDYHFVGN